MDEFDEFWESLNLGDMESAPREEPEQPAVKASPFKQQEDKALDTGTRARIINPGIPGHHAEGVVTGSLQEGNRSYPMIEPGDGLGIIDPELVEVHNSQTGRWYPTTPQERS